MHELTHILTAFGLIVIISSMVGFVMLVGVFLSFTQPEPRSFGPTTTPPARFKTTPLVIFHTASEIEGNIQETDPSTPRTSVTDKPINQPRRWGVPKSVPPEISPG
jgi:hypothetical protein